MILNIKNSKIVNFLLNVHKETRGEKTYAYQILLSFKTSVTFFKNNFNFTPDNYVRCEVAFVGYNSIFCRIFRSATLEQFS